MPPTGERVSVGYVRRAHGIRGEVVVRPLSDNPERYRQGNVLQSDEDPPRDLEIVSVREHKDGLIVAFAGITDRSAAEAMPGVTLTIDRDDRRGLEDGEYWPDDLQGLSVIASDGSHLGVITGVVLGDAQDRIVVTTPAGIDVEVPFVDELVGEIHPSGGHIVVTAPDGLFP